MDEDHPKLNLTQRVAREVREYAVISLYLYVCLGALLLYKGALLRAEEISYAPYGRAGNRGKLPGGELALRAGA